jgi:lipopolysaccharide/colanic/teichoic acid biosynthesis glycosyltransferase
MKRLFDIFVAGAAILILLPVIIVIAVFVKFMMGSPILFRQQRPGLAGRSFQMIKFRTMIDELDANGNLLRDSQRLTQFGRFLRATSLDELPELWNVIEGKMSLVGPRPLLIQYLPLYSAEQSRRHNVLPGITGWAQVNGRNALTWEEKFALDVWYVDNHSFWLDLRILVKTLVEVFKRTGISNKGHSTMPPFGGTK